MMNGDRPHLNLAHCLRALGPLAVVPDDGESYCNATWDGILCWPATRADLTIQSPCPALRGLDASKFTSKRCTAAGRWAGRYPDEVNTFPQGWTNYSQCYRPGVKAIADRLFANIDVQTMKKVAQGARVIEMVGLTVSLVSLVVSIFIFCYFRNLRCNRTRIHRNLFIAMLIHVSVQLVKDVDWYVARSFGEVAGVSLPSTGTIMETPIVCEALVTMVEYTRTVVLFWMFIEGMYLHNMVAVTVFSAGPNYILYYAIGWGIPALVTAAWVVAHTMINDSIGGCWFLYHFRPIFWIIVGTRIAVITVNMLFLLNIIRVLVTKLRETGSTEVMQLKKAVKAAMVLLPLLGFNSFLDEIHPPTDNLVKYALVSYVQRLLFSFQGFVIALLYCFLNEEVRSTFRSSWMRYQQSRGRNWRRRPSGTLSVSISEMTYHQMRIDETCLTNGSKRSAGTGTLADSADNYLVPRESNPAA